MGLVNDNETDIHVLEIGLEELRAEPLGGEVEELRVAVSRIVQCQVHVPARHSRIYRQCLYASVVQVLHLIFHQCYQRSYDQSDAFFHQCRYLKTD